MEKGDRQTYLAMIQTAAMVQNRGNLEGAVRLFYRLASAMRNDPESFGLGIVEFNIAVLNGTGAILMPLSSII